MAWKVIEVEGVKYGVLDENGDPIRVTPGGVEKPVVEQNYLDAQNEARERKEEVKALKAQLEPIKGIEDVTAMIAEYNELKEMKANAPDATKAVEEQARELAKQMTKPKEEAWARERETLLARETAHKERIRKLAIGDAMSSLTVKLHEDYRELVLENFRKNLEVDDESVFYKLEDGKPMFGENGRATPDEALRIIVGKHPNGKKWTDGLDASGFGTNPAGGNSFPSGNKVRSAMSAEEKVNFIDKHGQEAFRKLPE